MWKSSGGELYTFYKICPWTSSTWSLDRHKLHKHDKRPSCEFRTRCRMSRSNHIWNTMLQSQLTTSAFKANRESCKNEHGQLQEYCKVSVQTKQLTEWHEIRYWLQEPARTGQLSKVAQWFLAAGEHMRSKKLTTINGVKIFWAIFFQSAVSHTFSREHANDYQ